MNDLSMNNSNSAGSANKTAAVVGAGAAGISAALRLAENGFKVALVSLQPSARAQSVMAEGGINGALGPDDSCELHAEETLRAGRFLESAETVKGLAEAAPDIIKWLDDMGMSFKHDDEGRPALRAFGGQSRKRTAFADASTGRQLMSTLSMLLRKYESDGTVMRLDHHVFIRLLYSGRGASDGVEGAAEVSAADGVNGSSVYGAVLYDNVKRKYMTLKADAVIIASGGMNDLFGSATGSVSNSGSVTASLFADGVPVANGEFIQYHPTTVKMRGKNMLVTEAVRGEGGRLFTLRNGKRWYFMEEMYPKQGNLAPRDVISREEWRLISSGHEIFLDMTCIDPEICRTRLQGVIDDCREYFGIDPLKEPLKVRPGIHFFMGGIKVDGEHRAPVRGLYAAGECASIYHGANRLGGNSLLGAVCGGRKAAETLINDAADGIIGKVIAAEMPDDLSQTEQTPAAVTGRAGSLAALRARLNAAMQRAMGIERDEASLDDAAAELEKMEADAAATYDPNAEPYEREALVNSIMLARALVMSARERRESRGAHQRADHPGESDAFLKRTVAHRARVTHGKYIDGNIHGNIFWKNYEPPEIEIYFEEI